ncbi:hypothetical protein OG2516_17201 [Oceanicola granulosus HTCC2516]|uniref:Uncharacterized protein n=1 Tax=Oceanicola granulosus (strain ATCC BAA-861 / DSM 15982 / KCTC 12143 / HTCC2516) TaxID=314256 RepID=Q2CFK3_OCEGH|nr:hypothetical protein [Oceanicola granulosus]EAR51479.1 hypothetical protein OG2516_17201 [Oceanicola granulosus HTCC2516]
MAKLIERFWDDENGDPLVDWIVLAAGVVMLATAILGATLPASRTFADNDAAIMTEAGA